MVPVTFLNARKEAGIFQTSARTWNGNLSPLNPLEAIVVVVV